MWIDARVSAQMPYKRYNRNKSPIVAATSERTVELCHDETEPLSDLTVTIFPLGQTSSDINVKVNVGLSVPRKWMKLSPADQDRTNLKSIVNQDQVFQASGILTRTAPVVKLSRFPQKLKDESIMVYVKAVLICILCHASLKINLFFLRYDKWIGKPIYNP